ncbi:MAG: glutamate-5-semialdehyde dehydrogenase [bacterium]
MSSFNLTETAKNARQAARTLAAASTEVKNRALEAIAVKIESNKEKIQKINQKDIEAGKKQGLSDALLDRLLLTPERITGMVEGIRQVKQLTDPVGEVLEMQRRPNGLKIGRQRVPLGVIGIIYESRPNVTVDAAVLCLKSGNCTILRGGSEAQHSNYFLVDIIQEAISPHLPATAVQIMRSQAHSLVDKMLKMDRSIDIIIPRGGENLIRMVTEKSTIPVIKHYKGVCHTYVSEQADKKMAKKICVNAKTQRPGVCNAMETLVLNKNLPLDFIKDLLATLHQAGVQLKVDGWLVDLLAGSTIPLEKASESDWNNEYLDLILNVKTVADLSEAIDHINTYASNHSDAIITENYSEAERFINEVDSAAVYVNASTRFTDGFEFGLGAEIGISTERLHARGPMGLRELTIPKYIIYGQGQIRS